MLICSVFEGGRTDRNRRALEPQLGGGWGKRGGLQGRLGGQQRRRVNPVYTTHEVVAVSTQRALSKGPVQETMTRAASHRAFDPILMKLVLPLPEYANIRVTVAHSLPRVRSTHMLAPLFVRTRYCSRRVLRTFCCIAGSVSRLCRSVGPSNSNTSRHVDASDTSPVRLKHLALTVRRYTTQHSSRFDKSCSSGVVLRTIQVL